MGHAGDGPHVNAMPAVVLCALPPTVPGVRQPNDGSGMSIISTALPAPVKGRLDPPGAAGVLARERGWARVRSRAWVEMSSVRPSDGEEGQPGWSPRGYQPAPSLPLGPPCGGMRSGEEQEPPPDGP